MEGLHKSIKLDLSTPVIETDKSKTVAERSISEITEKKTDDSKMKHTQNSNIIDNWFQVRSYSI